MPSYIRINVVLEAFIEWLFVTFQALILVIRF